MRRADSGKGGADLVPLGEAAACFLGEDQVPVSGDLEDAAGAGDDLQAGNVRLEEAEDLLRQTGGAGKVASGGAVLDPDLHGHRTVEGERAGPRGPAGGAENSREPLSRSAAPRPVTF